MYYTDDPVRDAERREADWEDELERFPECRCCGCRITSEKLWHIEGDFYCPECAEENFTEWTENHIA
jgi:hypothetical protein